MNMLQHFIQIGMCGREVQHNLILFDFTKKAAPCLQPLKYTDTHQQVNIYYLLLSQKHTMLNLTTAALTERFVTGHT